MVRRFRGDEPEDRQPYGSFQPIQLPVNLNLLVYPRQSTPAQLLHHATSTGMLLGLLVDVSGETPVPVPYHHQVTNHRDPNAEPVMYYICQEPGQVPPRRFSAACAVHRSNMIQPSMNSKPLRTWQN